MCAFLAAVQSILLCFLAIVAPRTLQITVHELAPFHATGITVYSVTESFLGLETKNMRNTYAPGYV